MKWMRMLPVLTSMPHAVAAMLLKKTKDLSVGAVLRMNAHFRDGEHSLPIHNPFEPYGHFSRPFMVVWLSTPAILSYYDALAIADSRVPNSSDYLCHPSDLISNSVTRRPLFNRPDVQYKPHELLKVTHIEPDGDSFPYELSDVQAAYLRELFEFYLIQCLHSLQKGRDIGLTDTAAVNQHSTRFTQTASEISSGLGSRPLTSDREFPHLTLLNKHKEFQ
jgi:hypothetical protein